MQIISANFGGSQIDDIGALSGMPLKSLCLNHSNVDDISALEGMPLERLEICHTKISDMSPIAKAPLDALGIQGTLVKDLSPLRGSTIRDILLNSGLESQSETLSSMPNLKIVNGRPLEELLKSQQNQVPKPE